jgi:hypothetical protein
MSLLDTLRAGIATANTLTKDLQGSVQHYAWTGQDGFGADQFASPVTRRALVDLSRKLRATSEGRLQMTVAIVTFLDVIAPNGASGRVEPVDDRDRIVLPDGTTGPIIRGGGFMDATTGRPLFNEIMIGALPGGGA